MIPIRIDGLLVKEEASYATDAEPVAATDGVRVSERVWSALRVEHKFLNKRDEVATGTLLPAPPTRRGGRIVTLELAVELRGPGVAPGAAALPECAALLRSCGHQETVVEGTSVAYTLDSVADSATHKSCTIYAFAGGALFKIVGCRGTVRWPVQAGNLGTLRITMSGILVEDPAAAALPQITYDAVLPPAAVGMTITLGGWGPDLVSSEFTQAAAIASHDGARAAQGVARFAIASALPQYTAQVKAVALGTYNPYTIAEQVTQQAILQELGVEVGNHIRLDATGYLQSPGHANQEGFAGWDLTYDLTAYTLTFL